MKSRTRTILRRVGFCLCSGLLLVAFSVGVLWLKMIHDDRLARVEIQKRLDAIRAAGQPLTAEDLAKLYPDPPPEHDAALLLKPALAALAIPEDSTNLPFFGRDLPAGNTPLAKPVLDEMQIWLKTNSEALGAVPWNELNYAWIGSNFPEGITNPPVLSISKVNSIAKFSCLEAVSEAESQRPKEAIQSLRHALAIESIWRNDTPLHSMVKYSIENFVCESLNRVLDRTIVADSDLASFAASLTKTNLGAATNMLAQERCAGLFIADNIKSLANQTTRPTFSPVRYLIRSYEAKLVYRDQDLLNYLEWYERCLAAMDLPLSNAIPTLIASEKARSAYMKLHRPSFLNTFKKERLSFMTTEEFTVRPFLLAEAKVVAFVHATQTAIAIERWRLAHNGNPPDSLAQLVPGFLQSVPTDPFDEQPLRYKKLARGYVVFSIGPDFTDDGGKEKPANAKEADHYDITFTVER